MAAKKMKLCQDLECKVVAYITMQNLTDYMDRFAWIS